MLESPETAGEMRVVHAAIIEVARGLARAQGQRQFHGLSVVQAQLNASHVDPGLWAWIFAAFVAREDFEALFALREAPGTYAGLREAMSAAVAREASPGQSFEASELEIDDLWDWLGVLEDVVGRVG